MKRMLILAAALPLGGCVVGTIAKTAVDIATLPVKVASAGVDKLTTSQAEADQNAGREMRKADEARGRAARAAAKKAAEQPQSE